MTTIDMRRLDCGATLVTERIDGVSSAAIDWLVPAGCAYEPEPRQGAGAMWSELLVRGSGTLDSRGAADAFDRLGAGRACEVGMLFMRLHATLLGERAGGVLPLLADMVLRPRMAEEAVEPSRDLALQALESLRDNPQERATLAARARHFPSPFNRSGMGTEEGLRALTRADLASAWSRLAVPSGSIIAAAGRVDPDAMAADLNRLLDGWSGAHAEPARGPAPARGYAHEPDETNQVQILLVHDAPSERDEASSVLERIVVSVLSGGMSGRLFSEVREKRGLCYSVSAGYRGDRDFGSVTAYVGTTPERAQESLDVLVAELGRIGAPAGAVTPEEFQRAVIGMKSRLVFSGESTGARAGAIASDTHRLGRARTLDELARRIDAVTLDQVNAYLAGRTLGTVTVQTLGPRELKPPL